MPNRVWSWHGESRWTLDDAPTPEPGSGQVLVKINSVGFCGSEKAIEKEPVEHLTPAQLSSLPLAGGRGHEVAGVVEEVGAGVTTCKPGDRVAVLHIMGCKKCRFCTSGFENNCPYPREHVSLRGYADYMVVPPALAYPIPDDMPMDEAAMVEPAAIGVHVVEKMTRVRPGETVVIFGVGQIGTFCAQAAKVCGARVIAVDSRELARRSAQDLGIDVVVDPARENVNEVVMEETGGIGADAILEAAGDADNYSLFVDMLAPCGRIVKVGTLHDRGVVPLDLSKMFSKEASLITSKACVGMDYDRTLNLVRWGKIKLNWLGGQAIKSYPTEDFLKAREEWMDLQNMLYVIMP